MAKYLLLSILIATVGLPIYCSRAKTTRAGLRRLVWSMSFFIFGWVFFCVYLFLRMGGGY
ncbi:MAG TPA: hypothetical protein VGM06_12690 [Polyangiaceae bacterium]